MREELFDDLLELLDFAGREKNFAILEGRLSCHSVDGDRLANKERESPVETLRALRRRP